MAVIALDSLSLLLKNICWISAQLQHSSHAALVLDSFQTLWQQFKRWIKNASLRSLKAF